MSILGKSDWLADEIARLLKVPARVHGDVATIFARATPLARLAAKAVDQLQTIERYRTVRETFLAHGGKMLEELYKETRAAVLKVGAKADSRLRSEVAREVKAWDQLLIDLKKLGDVAVDFPTTAAARLTAEDLELFRTFTRNLLETDDPLAGELQAAWRHYVRVVGPDNEGEWAMLLGKAREIGEQLRPILGEVGEGRSLAADQFISGSLNPLQGLAFELYGRRCLALLDEIDRAMRSAAVKAARLGDGWQTLHVNGELRLASVSKEALDQILKAGRITPETPIDWKQFADDAVLAAKLPDGAGRLAEFDAAAFMEFKAEGGSSKLGEKLLSFHRRHTAGAGGDPLLIRFTAPDGKEVIGLLRPPDPREPVAYYAVATSNTRVPTTKELAGLGIDQRKVTTDLSRDDLRDLVKDLVYTAMSLSKVQGTP